MVNLIDDMEDSMPIITAPSAPTHELPGTRFTSLATPSRGEADVSVWQVEIQPGTKPVPHRLTKSEVFVVLGGEAEVRLGDDVSHAVAGDVIVVPAQAPFALEVRGEEPFRAHVSMPVDGQAVMDDGAPFTPPWAL